jgi:hypothetical protein
MSQKLDLELKCKSAGLQLHSQSVAVWNNMDTDGKGQRPEPYNPLTKYDQKNNACLLLTGYRFHLKDEKGFEQREVVKVIDVVTGKEIESLLYGWGHEPGRGQGKRSKDNDTINKENEAMNRHQELLREFTR